MSQIIDALPVLVFVGVILFFGGVCRGPVSHGSSSMDVLILLPVTGMAVPEVRSAPLTFIADRINGHFPTITDCSRGRDDRGIETSPGLEHDAYLWVSKQINMSQQS
jgi:hypothetical protein